MKIMILGAVLFGLGGGAALAAPGGVSFPQPAGGAYTFLGDGDVSVTYDGVTFAQSGAYGGANLFVIGSQYTNGFPPVLSSQNYDGGMSNILVSLPAVVDSLTIWFGTFDASPVTFTLSNGHSSTLTSTGSGYITFDTFSSNERFDWVRLTTTDGVLNIGSVSYDTAAVPEPASWMLMIGGFGAIGGVMRRRKTAVSFG